MRLKSKIFAQDFPFATQHIPFHYGWIIFFVALAIRTISIPGATLGLCPFTEPLLHHLNISRTHFSNLLLIATFFSIFPLTFFGKIFDRIGVRKATTYSGIALGFVLICLGQIQTIIEHLSVFFGHDVAVDLALFLGLFLLRLIGQNLIPLACRLTILLWYPNKSCTMLGFGGIFVSLIFGLAPRYIDALIATYNFLNVWTMLGFGAVIASIFIVWLFCRDNPDVGHSANNNETVLQGSTLAQALRTFDFWLFVSAATLSTFTTTSLQIHIVDLFREANACIDNPFTIFIPLSIISAAFGFAFSIFQDRLPIVYTVIAIFISNALTMWSVEFISSPVMLWSFVTLMGINWGLYGIIYAAPWPRLFGQKHLAHIMSAVSFIAFLGAAIAPLLMSLSRDFGSYFYITRIMAQIATVGTVVSIIYAKIKARSSTNY